MRDRASETHTLGLIERLRRGDDAAATELFRVHGERLRRAFHLRLPPGLRGVIEEDDLVQTTLLEALRGLDRFEWRGQGAFLAWLFQIGVHRLLREARSRQRAPRGDTPKSAMAESEMGEESVLAQVPGRESTPSRRAARHEELHLLDALLQRLPDDDRELIIRREILEQDSASIAEDLGITAGAVRMRCGRLLNRMARWRQEGLDHDP